MAFCTECGGQIPDGLRFCTVCGAPQAAQAAPAAAPIANAAPIVNAAPVASAAPMTGAQPQYTAARSQAQSAVNRQPQPQYETARQAQQQTQQRYATAERAQVQRQQPPPQPAQARYAPPVMSGANAAPGRSRPAAVMGVGAYFGALLLFSIPIVGWIACIVMAFTGDNQNRKNFARAMLIYLLIGIVLGVILYIVAGWVLEVFAEYMAGGVASGLFG